MSIVTILTPTYNRAGMLPKLYAALLAQTSHDFMWLIVDDGSTDDTEKIVAGWQTEGQVQLAYVRQENGGKHRALNTGVAMVDTPLTFIVDSDDLPLPCAVSEIERVYERYGAEEKLCGFAFTNVNREGKLMTSKALTQAEEIATFARKRMKEYSVGDMSEVWFTKDLQAVPFPEFEGERFYSETGVWLRISGAKPMVFVNTPILQRDYFADGLTKNRTAMLRQSPRGVLDVSRLLMARECGWRFNLRGGLRYCVFAHRLGMSAREAIRQSGRPVLAALCYVPSLLLRRRWA